MKLVDTIKQDKILFATTKTLLIIICLLSILGISAWSFAKAYEYEIYPLVKINSISLSGKSPQKALKDLEANVIKDTEKIIIEVNDKKIVTTLKDLGIKLQSSQTISEAYGIGRTANFLKTDKNIHLAIAINQDIISETIKKFDAEIIKPATDAKVYIENGEIKIKKEENGATIDFKGAEQAFQGIAFGKNYIYKINTKIEFPQVAQADLMETKANAQKILDREITLVLDNKTFSPSLEQKWEMLVIEGKTISFSNEGIDEYLLAISNKVNVKAVPQRIYEDGAIETEGKDGLILDTEKALAEIKIALSGEKTQVALAMKEDKRKISHINRPFTPGLYPGKYIEVNLATQTLYQMEGQSVVGSHRVSSGKPGMSTPTGTYSILSKVNRAYSSTYNLYMPYWMAFVGSKYGLHELPEWANGYKEGQNHLGIPVSHGCVRLGIGDAAQVYNWAEVGTPVYIHS